jgi:hypothetical protein
MVFEPAPLEPRELSLLPLLRELPGGAVSSGLLEEPDGVPEG